MEEKTPSSTQQECARIEKIAHIESNTIVIGTTETQDQRTTARRQGGRGGYHKPSINRVLPSRWWSVLAASWSNEWLKNPPHTHTGKNKKARPEEVHISDTNWTTFSSFSHPQPLLRLLSYCIYGCGITTCATTINNVRLVFKMLPSFWHS